MEDLFRSMEDQVGEPAKAAPPVPWMMERFIDPVSKQHLHLESFQQRILRHALQMDDKGYSKYNLVVWSEPKKSGKTTIAGGVGAWIATEVEQPNEVSCVANDQEQSAGRIFSAMKPTLDSLGWKVSTSPQSTIAYNSNGSMVKAITCNYAGEAGGNQGASLWSELWAYKGERLQRLWEEMTPPPTRKFRMQWVETYAGFMRESRLLWGLYTRIFKDATEKELQPGVAKLWRDLPVYALEDERVLMFWSHKPRMPWQTADYYAFQQAHMRASAFKRLHKNLWVDSDEKLITDEMWNNSCRRAGPLLVPATYALDGAKNMSCIALIGTVKIGSVVHTTDVHIWEPNEDRSDIDQGEVMRTVLELKDKGLLRQPLYYDPYQLVKLAQDLRNKGVSCVEFPQQGDRIKADTHWYKLYKEGTMVNWPHPLLKRHVTNANGKSQGPDKEDLRIIKPEELDEDDDVMHVDGAVAQSMSAYKAYTAPAGGWSASGL